MPAEERHLAKRGLTDRHMQVLAVVYFDGIGSLEHLVEETGFDVVEVERLCAELEAAGCITRTTIH
jgi:DNA-binding MarR family transcriptional regulator